MGLVIDILQSALKRKRADDSSICIPADIKNDLRLIRRDLGFHEKKEVLELTLPKEDKYALLPEPYCVLIGKTNSSVSTFTQTNQLVCANMHNFSHSFWMR